MGRSIPSRPLGGVGDGLVLDAVQQAPAGDGRRRGEPVTAAGSVPLGGQGPSVRCAITAGGPFVPKTVYQLKITLLEVRPPPWRRVVVPSDITLARLHDVIQAAMGWWDCHLHEFEIGGARYGVGDGETWGEPPRDERRARLGSLVGEGDAFLYVYDFGDYWRHRVTVEKVRTAEPGERYPCCIGGRRACPPEDVGGPMGYTEFLAAITDPGHPEHDSMLEWVGGAFDPDAFDPADCNHRLTLGRLAAI